MNEVTQIHLGRQAFTIAVDAHRELRTYLDAIKAQVKDDDVTSEVELRMAELLGERGISGDKVVLLEDVEYVMTQLGDPQAFGDSDPDTAQAAAAPIKRLFRDTQTGILAGVAAGLGNYFRIDAWVFRLVFLIGIFSGGWGILLYIALWLVVPEAKTPSDRLQMVGKPVTVNGIKEVLARADVKGAAQRANQNLSGPINAIFRFILRFVGIGFVVVGLMLLFACIAFESYALIHGANGFSQSIFPVGFREHLLLDLAVGLAALGAIAIIVIGIAIFKQRWPIKAWVTGTLVGLLLLGLAGAIGLGADVAPQVRDRYNANLHTTVRTVQPFTTVRFSDRFGDGAEFRFQQASEYSVSLHYLDNPNISAIKTSVTGQMLTIDTSGFDNSRHCDGICIPSGYDMVITVNSPVAVQTDKPTPPDFPFATQGKIIRS